MLHGLALAYVLQVLHDVAGALDEVPCVKDAGVGFGRCGELRVCFERGYERAEKSGYLFLFLGCGNGDHGCEVGGQVWESNDELRDGTEV